MSYCRFSTNDFTCDLYVYADARGGFTAHVAVRRRTGTLPESFENLCDLAGKIPDDEWKARNKAYWAAIETAESTDLPAPSTGNYFNTETPGEMADKLITLRGEGFNVPSNAIAELREDQSELDASDGGLKRFVEKIE